MNPQPIPAIPGTAFVPCPKVGFKNVRVATSCPGCEFYRGMVQVDRPVPFVFVQAMRVGCAHPVTRAMIHVEA
jgi:hypothetical protein